MERTPFKRPQTKDGNPLNKPLNKEGSNAFKEALKRIGILKTSLNTIDRTLLNSGLVPLKTAFQKERNPINKGLKSKKG